MAKSDYTDEPRVKVEMTHPVSLDHDDLELLAAGGTVRVPVTLSSEVVLTGPEADDG